MNARIALIPVLLTLAACDNPVKEPGTDPSTEPGTDTGTELDTGTETDTDTDTDPDSEEPIDCETDDWSDWSDCSAECGGGTRERTREVTVPAANGGEECGELFEEEECNTDACDVIDVSVVHYDGGGVSRLNSTSWSSSSSEGTEIWTEQLRDEWSVYLSNDSGDELQLDLWTQEVYITSQGGNREVLAAITESDPSRLNGWSGTRAVYDGGAFVQLDETLWVENNENGPHTWEELARDEWSIYLYDSARHNYMQLDLWLMEAIYTNSEGTQWSLYTITEADQIDGWMMRDVLHSQGHFVQTGYTSWEEVNSQGVAEFSFEQWARDEWSSYLYDSSRGVYIQLDLWTSEIRYSTDADPKSWVLYTVDSAY